MAKCHLSFLIARLKAICDSGRCLVCRKGRGQKPVHMKGLGGEEWGRKQMGDEVRRFAS